MLQRRYSENETKLMVSAKKSVFLFQNYITMSSFSLSLTLVRDPGEARVCQSEISASVIFMIVFEIWKHRS